MNGRPQAIVERLRRFAFDRSGGIIMAFALGAPALALAVCGAIDLMSVSATKAEAQGAADAAALEVAHQIGVADTSGIPARAEAFALGQLKDSKNQVAYTVTTTLDPKAFSVTVALDGTRPSFFMNLLPPGGWKIHAAATAVSMGRQPLCVLSSGADSQYRIDFQGSSKLTAPNCMVQSNGDIKVGGSAMLSAAAVQAGGIATGPISPSAQVGAAPVADPFASMPIVPGTLICNPFDVLNTLGILGITLAVPPGVHCGNINVLKDQTINLLPGEHYFKSGQLNLASGGTVTGDDVVLVFDKNSTFNFRGNSLVRLKGRRSGVLAGFVLATTRANTNTFTISSDNCRELLGTIYVPAATLQVTGTNNSVADQSAWTVVVAKALKLSGSPQLTINAHYGGSGVPVPTGVGPTAANVALAK